MPRWNTAAVRSRTLARLSDERGIALIMALGILFVLTITLGTVIYVTSASARHAENSNAGQKAYALAEAGVQDAMALLNANYPDSTNPYPGNWCLLHPQTPPAGFPGTELTLPACTPSAPFTSTPDASRTNETATWWGRVRRVLPHLGVVWVIRSTGSVPNPTGPGAAPVTRTLTVKVPIVIPPAQDAPPGVLNWLYSTTNATALQSVDVHSPFYVRGNLTLGNGVTVHAPLYVTCTKPPVPVPTIATPCPSTAGNVLMEQTGVVAPTATVAIGGFLKMETDGPNGNQVGESGAPVGEAHIVNGCKWKTEPIVAPCEWGRTNKVRVYAPPAKRDQIMPSDPIPNPPVIDWPFWYQYGSPGPTWGCDSGTVPQFDTGDGLLNNSVPGVFNLVGGASYSCKTLAGELTWDATNKKLKIKGTIYIDGSAMVEKSWGGQEAASYEGQGAIYLSGSFLLKNTQLCAVVAANGKDCNVATGAWDPNANALIVVAKSKGSDPGSQAAAGNDSVEVKSSQFQGVLSGTYDILSETTSVVQGPVISTNGGIFLNQTSGASFPDIHFPPSGAPGNPPPPSELLDPQEFEGG
jgi:hypothetical protein